MKSGANTTSTFHEEKTGDSPSVMHAVDVAKFKSAKSAIDKDLSHLLNSKEVTTESDLVYSIHFSDINGLSRLENNILAHEISGYLGSYVYKILPFFANIP